jgi:4'-phosphopantetheinyl transferase
MKLAAPGAVVEVWTADLDRLRLSPGDAREWLSAEELARAERQRDVTERNRFLIARAWLRRLLGRQLGVDPGVVALGSGPFGKPMLDPFAGGESLQFNLSHSANHVACALAADDEVGIDIERIQPAVATPDVAAPFLTTTEMTQVFSRPGVDATVEFFRRWTLKEAVLKAAGTGLHADPRDVLLKPIARMSARDLPMWRTRFAERDWAVCEFSLGPNVAGAVAMAGEGMTIRRHHGD